MPTAFDSLYASRLRAVGTRFLRQRPVVAAFGAVGNAAMLASSSAPRAQVLGMGVATGSVVLAFFVESWVLRRRALSERWLAISLSLTALAIGAGAGASGGLESPLLPLLFAPTMVGLAAFGARPPSAVLLGGAALILAALAVAPSPLPPIPAPHRGWMVGWSTLTAFALTALGVGGLVGAYRSIGASLDRMRADVIEEAASRARESEALGAKVAHEIRNPLTAVKGLVQMLARRPLARDHSARSDTARSGTARSDTARSDTARDDTEPRDQRRFEVVLEEIDRMETILEEYLTLARPLSDLKRMPVRPRALIEEVAVLVEASANARGVRVRCTGDAGEAVVDPRRIREALLNLARNALAAMPTGGTLELSVHTDGGDLCLTVRDDGEGMAPELAAKVGAPFVSGGREGGSGLGLALVSSVARQHGGALILESALGEGTAATIRVPIHGGGAA